MAISINDKIKVLLKLFSKPRILSALLSQMHSGYLKDEGWFNSFLNKIPVDKLNNPIPWLTYPCISFIDERLNKDTYNF